MKERLKPQVPREIDYGNFPSKRLFDLEEYGTVTF